MQAHDVTLKLPVLKITLKAWSSVARNLGLACRLYWPWMAIGVVCLLAWGVGVLLNSGFSAPSPVLIGGAVWIPGLVMVLATILAVPTVFVGWHRGIQSGTRPAQPIVIDAGVWGYIGYSLLIGVTLVLTVGLFALIATVIAGITTGLGDGPMSLERFAALAPFLPLAIVPYYILLSRFSLVLPAIAIGRTMSLGDSFQKTRGNTWRLTFGAGLIYLPVVLLSSTLEIVRLAFPDSMGLIGSVSILVLVASLYCTHAALSFGTFALERLSPADAMAADAMSLDAMAA
ncbi:MAG: hypothetical protein AB7L90_14960 [Hyphomicrobiaceae bacterium]